MAGGGQLTNVFDTYDVVGMREDLSDLISDISPTDTPFISNIGSAPASNRTFEWQTDALDAAAQNHQVDGFDITTFSAITATVRLCNYTSISEKDWIISGSEEAVNKAGRQSEAGYQAVKAAKALKRDVETNYLANNAAVAGNGSTARETGGLAAWLKTNVNLTSTNGANPDWATCPTDARSDGELRTFTETIAKDVIFQCWDSGGEPTMVLVGGKNKQTFSTFAGIAAQRFMASGQGQSTIIGAADIYISDFGEFAVVPSRFQRGREAFFVDPDRARRRVLRPYFATELAKTGDAEKRMFVCEEGLQIDNEAAHGIAADLSTS